jgi:hypothetical protein
MRIPLSIVLVVFIIMIGIQESVAQDSRPAIEIYLEASNVRISPRLQHQEKVEKKTGKTTRVIKEEVRLKDFEGGGLLTIGGANPPPPPPGDGWEYVGPTTLPSGAADKAKFVRRITMVEEEKIELGELRARVKYRAKPEADGTLIRLNLETKKKIEKKGDAITPEHVREFTKRVNEEIAKLVKELNQIKVTAEELGKVYLSTEQHELRREFNFFAGKHEVLFNVRAVRKVNLPFE